jgi:hypothetical protein
MHNSFWNCAAIGLNTQQVLFDRNFQEAGMFLKSMCFAVFGATLVTAGALAAEYRPDDFLTLDLPKAVLSPTPLGPRNQFVPMPAEAKSDLRAASKSNDRTDDHRASQARAIAARVAKRNQMRPGALAHAQKARGAARVRLAHRHGNPLDARAQALDHHIQIWPCRSGGICRWKPAPVVAGE